ncbi:MAG TPA: ATP synthase F1 subunit delta [Candidatus Acetothermia bacterium]|nr:ATP synthase F1 subunit delta [Candidatus Acetothermia bacterium]
MKDPEVAERYAKALHSLAREEGILDRIGEDLALLRRLWETTPDLDRFLEHPLVPVELKEEFFDRALGEHVHPYTLNFLKLLARKRRLDYLPLIQRAFLKAAEKEGLLVSVLLRTAMPLSDEELAKLRGILEETLGKPVVLEVEEAPELLAGAELRLLGKRFDLSLAGRLQALATELKG